MSISCNRYRILIIDFGSQYTQLLLRRIRDLGVYSESHPWNINQSEIREFNPSGIILSGGPNSVLEVNSPKLPECIFQLNIPILGICYGMQIMALLLGGQVQYTAVQREFGYAQITLLNKSALINNICDIDERVVLDVWMSHGDTITIVPKGFTVIGVTKYSNVAIMANEAQRLYGVQFHPEVTHTIQGNNILKCFVMDICGCKSEWKPVNIIDSIVTNIRETVGNDMVILAFSGGIDSFVTALLLQRAIGSRCVCVFINHGLLSEYESNQFDIFYKKYCNLNIIYLLEEKRFFDALDGVFDPEKKRKIIGKVFIEIFEEQVRHLVNIRWLAQGTIYSDIIESGMACFSVKNVIKSHHNVGGLPDLMHVKLLEPIKNLFKDEVRNIGLNLGLPKDILDCYPFPGPGLAIRVIGEIKKEYCNILRQSDFIFFEELRKANWYTKISQAFTVFLPIRSVGIQGDRRQYNWVIALRAVETVDFMTARWARLPYDFLDKVSNRIVNEVQGVSRVVYDVSCKPPATIEWE